jgi:2-hydroxychromene-2-carboxylate isomerase
MSKQKPQVEYYFSFISLWSYVGSLVFQDMVRRRDVDVVYKPIDLLAVFAAGGGKPVRERPVQRQAYRLVEMERWKAIRDIPLVTWPKFYPADPSLGHRMLLIARDQGQDVGTFAHAGLKAVWADELNIADRDTLIELANRSGLDGAKLVAAAESEQVRQTEADLTHEAIDRQLFGAPFYFYRDEPFWGQDRLDLLDAAIAEGRAAIPFPAV